MQLRRRQDRPGWLTAVAAIVVCCGPPTLTAIAADEPVQVGLSETFAQAAADGPYPETPNFQRHIVPLLGRLGCNGRNCHGSFQGRGGFRLSMFGYAFEEDHQALLDGDPPRVNLEQPTESLILMKPTDADAHEGGLRYERGGWEYRVLRAWIEAGAKQDSEQAGELVRIELTPAEIVCEAPGQSTQLRVVAVWSDGSREDVTCLTRFDTLDEVITEVTPEGVVTGLAPGDTYVIASYDNAVASVPVLMPLRPVSETPAASDVSGSCIDKPIATQLRKLRIVPSGICTDQEFIRRVSLDIAGTLPTPQQVQAFALDPAPDKRDRLIDELLDSPAHAVWWTTTFCDVMGLNGPLQLGSTDFGPIMTEHWRSWVERKLRDNLPYDQIVAGMVVAISRPPEQSYDDYAMQMTSYVRKQDPLDYTARETMPNYWFRGNLATAEDKALAFAYTFMGVRLDCAQCHKHPFDRWSQQDFQQFAAIFERVRWGVSPSSKDAHSQLLKELGVPEVLDTAAKRRQTYWRWAGEGKIVPWPEVFIEPVAEQADGDEQVAARPANQPTVQPKLLGDAKIDAHAEDPRRPLMDWLRRPDNPYFARAIVNRVWAHYFGRGIVEPADDLNLANPPSNPQLLAELSEAFIEHGYDLKWLHREITRSAAYQRSWRTNETNRHDHRQFSHAAIRRLPAEVALDAMLMATANRAAVDDYLNQMKDRRIAVQATADLSRTEFGLAVFGKPLRTVNCDCEREQQPSLAQAIFVRNDPDLYTMLDRPAGWLAELRGQQDLDHQSQRDEWIREAFHRTVSRDPHDREMARARKAWDDNDDKIDALRDLLWALINTQEFITNH